MANEQKPKDRENLDRRQLVGAASTVAMGAGLVAGYGALAAMAGRFLYPAHGTERQWMFVTQLDRMAKDDSLVYRAPSGETVNITRTAMNGEATDFVALSSVCPHLGCQVHWEGQNERYFCPCHNGTFDPEGVGTGGPPGDAGQSLPRYDVQVEGGLLYILVAVDGLTSADAACGEVIEASPSQAGHDPCLSPLRRVAFGPEDTAASKVASNEVAGTNQVAGANEKANKKDRRA